nr:disease resistance protein RPP13-like isoform X6 [Ipomoea batatas]
MKLRFCYMTFEGKTINIFSKLSKLEVLVLEECKWIGGEWKLLEHESFDQLIYLLISESNLERWEASASHFPNLEHLVLYWCEKLEKIPAEFAEIPNLKSIKVYGCLPSTVDSAKKIQKEQHEQGNDNMIVIEKEGTIKEWIGGEWELLEKEDFDHLIYLKISKSNIERWEASACHFRNLERLVLEWCQELEKIPAEFAEIPSLKSIKLYGCLHSAVDSAKEIQREQHEQGNDNMVVIEKDTIEKLLLNKYFKSVGEGFKSGMCLSLEIKMMSMKYRNTKNKVYCGVYVMWHMESYSGEDQKLLLNKYFKSVGEGFKSGMCLSLEIKMMSMKYRNTKNKVYCGVYVMWHMESYSGEGVGSWECGLAKGDRTELNRLCLQYMKEIYTVHVNAHRTSNVTRALRALSTPSTRTHD